MELPVSIQCAHTHRITSPNKIVHNWTWQ